MDGPDVECPTNDSAELCPLGILATYDCVFESKICPGDNGFQKSGKLLRPATLAAFFQHQADTLI